MTLSVVVGVLGCGYRPIELHVPPHVRRVAVRTFETGSAAPRLGGLIAQAIARDLTASGRIAIAAQRSADAVISGRVLELESRTAAFAAGTRGPRTALGRTEVLVGAVLEARDGRLLRRAGPYRLGVIRPVAAASDLDPLLEDRSAVTLADDAARLVVRGLFGALPAGAAP